MVPKAKGATYLMVRVNAYLCKALSLVWVQNYDVKTIYFAPVSMPKAWSGKEANFPTGPLWLDD